MFLLSRNLLFSLGNLLLTSLQSQLQKSLWEDHNVFGQHYHMIIFVFIDDFNIDQSNSPNIISKLCVVLTVITGYKLCVLKSLHDNDARNFVKFSNDFRSVGCEWAFNTKSDSKGNSERFKIRLVAKWFTQREWIDSINTFLPVSNKGSFRIIIALTNWFVSNTPFWFVKLM